MIYDSIFKNKTPCFDKLIAFGFVFDGERYVYSRPIADGQFEFVVYVEKKGGVRVKTIDVDTGEEYVVHLLSDAVGEFVGKVRAACAEVLQEIADNCFETKIFQSDFTESCIDYIRNTYREEPEFLWQKFPDNAIVRRKDNRKWYAVFLTVAKDKIGLDGDGKVEVIDLRSAPEDIDVLVDGKKYFGGYHMNKKHWMTMVLDGSVPLAELFELIDKSRELAKK